jgi:hypothetical protein
VLALYEAAVRSSRRCATRDELPALPDHGSTRAGTRARNVRVASGPSVDGSSGGDAAIFASWGTAVRNDRPPDLRVKTGLHISPSSHETVPGARVHTGRKSNDNFGASSGPSGDGPSGGKRRHLCVVGHGGQE